MIGFLGYNSKNGRYGLLISDLWEVDGFHCGDALELWDYELEKWVSTRIEMHFPDVWYLVGTGYSGSDLEGLKVRVK